MASSFCRSSSTKRLCPPSYPSGGIWIWSAPASTSKQLRKLKKFACRASTSCRSRRQIRFRSVRLVQLIYFNRSRRTANASSWTATRDSWVGRRIRLHIASISTHPIATQSSRGNERGGIVCCVDFRFGRNRAQTGVRIDARSRFLCFPGRSCRRRAQTSSRSTPELSSAPRFSVRRR
jgi:hypothetical protein